MDGAVRVFVVLAFDSFCFENNEPILPRIMKKVKNKMKKEAVI